MPLKKCQTEGDPGWRWGDSGKCYVGEDAKQKALRQGRAIEIQKNLSKAAEVATGERKWDAPNS